MDFNQLQHSELHNTAEGSSGGSGTGAARVVYASWQTENCPLRLLTTRCGWRDWSGAKTYVSSALIVTERSQISFSFNFTWGQTKAEYN